MFGCFFFASPGFSASRRGDGMREEPSRSPQLRGATHCRQREYEHSPEGDRPPGDRHPGDTGITPQLFTDLFYFIFLKKKISLTVIIIIL